MKLLQIVAISVSRGSRTALKSFAILSAVILLGACTTTSSYKARNSGLNRFGYVDRKIKDHTYTIEFFGTKSDSYKKLEAFWRKRARELCGSEHYHAAIEQKNYKGLSVLVIPTVVIIDHLLWPLVTGNATCETGQID